MKFPGQFYRWYQNLLSNPRSRGWVIALSLLYLVSPFDISPDFLPILGQIDDVVLISLLLSGLFQWLTERFSATETSTAHVQSEVNEPATRTIDVEAVSSDASQSN
ncbi:YkvA family protein [Sphaerothrix gracilis]|uniref:YkvA family protein n=1 Tax=Sphaerothrix gracilis TaxID=3151835 RepID=UPI0031FD7EE6